MSQQSSSLQRCFSRVAHPGSIEARGGTLLNQPCNSSHKMKVEHHKQEINIWGELHHKHEITETQSPEALRRGLCEREGMETPACGKKNVLMSERAAQRLTFPSKYESLASVRAANPTSNDANILEDNMP